MSVSAWRACQIEGVLQRTLPAHADQRGFLRELWRSSWAAPGLDADFVQANFSHSSTGVLRGFHFHRRQADLWVVLRGRAHVGLVDLRERVAGGVGLPTFSAELSAGEAVYIPERIAHGFWALEDLDLLYLVTNEYDGTDELGFAWDDPEVAFEWPSGRPLLSERDSSSPSLSEAISRSS